MDKRFRPVVVGKYLGDYTSRFTCWAIADGANANRIYDSRKFDTREQAQAHADTLNAMVNPEDC
jgi:hypothetical protein